LHIEGGLHLVSTGDVPKIENGNSITLSLPFLPCPSITFAASTVELTDGNNFSWAGRTIQHQDSLCASGDIIIQKNEGLIIGQFTIDDNSYELFDLTGGVQLLIASSLDLKGRLECATPPSITGTPPTVIGGPCENIKTKVLILYTNSTLDNTTDIIGTANLAVTQTNQIWANSEINNSLSIAGIVKLDSWTHAPGTSAEVNNLKIDPFISYLRDDVYKAEIVVLLGPSYNDAYGVVADIGGVKANAFAVVNVSTATNGRYTFAHEVNHLFGGRHDNDPDPGTAHGRTFHTGFLNMFNKRFTLMCNLPEKKTRLTHVSNPDVNFAGEATGSSNENNAAKVNQMKNYVAAFYPDAPLSLYAQMSINNPQPCNTNGSASVTTKCGMGPYSYKWYSTNNPLNGAWQLVGTTQSIATFIPLSSYGSYSKAYKVVVTDALSNTVTYIKYSQSYCTEPQIWEPIDPNSVEGMNNNVQLADNRNEFLSIGAVPKANIYPNPNTGQFTMELMGFGNEHVEISIVDLTGKYIVSLYKGDINGAKVIAAVIPEKLSKGIYFVKVKGKTNLTQKLILN